MPSAGLCTLPLEITKQITTGLYRPDLLSLAKTSRTLSNIATSELYRHIVLNEGEKNTLCICLLFRTLYENSHLANLVEHFGLLGSGLEAVPFTTIATLESLYDRAIRLFRLQWEFSGWDISDYGGDVSVLIPLLLLPLQTLRSIEFGVNYLLDWGLHLAFDQKISRLLSPKLKSIRLAGDLDQEGQKLQQNCWSEEEFLNRSPDAVFAEMVVNPIVILDVCTLKGLQTLDILLPLNMQYCHLTTASPSPSLKTLILRSTICGEDTLKQFLRMAPQLRNLTYERFYDPRERPNRLPDPGLLLEALIQAKDSLEELHIMLERYRYPVFGGNHTGGEDEYPGPDEPIGSLQELRKLHTLEIPVEILFGSGSDYKALATLLPASLCNLKLRNDFVYFEAFYPWRPTTLGDRLSTDLKAHSSHDGKLSIRHLHLGLHFDGYWWTDTCEQDMEDQLGPYCRDCDIKLTTRYEDRSIKIAELTINVLSVSFHQKVIVEA